MPPGLIEDQDSVRAGGDSEADLVEVHLHGFGVSVGHRQRSASITRRADCPEQIGAARAQVCDQSRTGASFGPYPGSVRLLPNPHLVLEPYLYGGVWGERRPDIGDFAREVFLKVAIASTS